MLVPVWRRNPLAVVFNPSVTLAFCVYEFMRFGSSTHGDFVDYKMLHAVAFAE